MAGSTQTAKVVLLAEGDRASAVVRQFAGTLDQAVDRINRADQAGRRFASGGGRALSTTIGDIITGAQRLPASLLLAGAAAAALAPMVNTYAEFGHEISNVGAVSGATAGELDMLAAAARGSAAGTVFSAQESAQAMYYLGSAGQGVNEIMATQPQIMDLAAATAAGLGEAAALTTATLGQFSLTAEESGRVANAFAASVAGSQATLPKLAAGMRQAGPVAASLGYSLEATTAALMGLYNAGYEGGQAGTILRASWSRLIAPTKEVGDTLARLNINTHDAAGNMLGLDQILDQLKASGASSADMIRLFGQEAGPGMMALLNQGGQALRDLETSITGTSAASVMASQQTDNLWGDFKLLASASEEAGLALMSTLDPALRGAVQGLTWATEHSFELTAALALGAAGWKAYSVAVAASRMNLSLLMATGQTIKNLATAITSPWGLAATAATVAVGGIIGIVSAYRAEMNYTGEETQELARQTRSAFDSWDKQGGKISGVSDALSAYDEKIKAAAGDAGKEREALEALKRAYPELVGYYSSVAQGMANVATRRQTMIAGMEAEQALAAAQAIAKADKLFGEVAGGMAEAAKAGDRLALVMRDVETATAFKGIKTERLEQARENFEKLSRSIITQMQTLQQVADNTSLDEGRRAKARELIKQLGALAERLRQVKGQSNTVVDIMSRIVEMANKIGASTNDIGKLSTAFMGLTKTVWDAQASLGDFSTPGAEWADAFKLQEEALAAQYAAATAAAVKQQEEARRAAKKSADDRRRIEEDLAEQVGALHQTDFDRRRAELDDYVAAYRLAGGNITAIEQNLASLRAQIDQEQRDKQAKADEDYQLAMAQASGDSLAVREIEHKRFLADWEKRGIKGAKAEALWTKQHAVDPIGKAWDDFAARFKTTDQILADTWSGGLNTMYGAFHDGLISGLHGDLDGLVDAFASLPERMAEQFLDSLADAGVQALFGLAKNMLGEIFGDITFGASGGGGGGFLGSLTGGLLAKGASKLWDMIFGGGTAAIANVAKTGLTNVATGAMAPLAVSAADSALLANGAAWGVGANVAAGTGASLAALDATAAATASQWAGASAASASMAGGAATGANAALMATTLSPAGVAMIIPALVAAGQIMDVLAQGGWNAADSRQAFAEAPESMARMVEQYKMWKSTGNVASMYMPQFEAYIAKLEKSAAAMGLNAEQTEAWIRALDPLAGEMLNAVKQARLLDGTLTGVGNAANDLASTLIGSLDPLNTVGEIMGHAADNALDLKDAVTLTTKAMDNFVGSATQLGSVNTGGGGWSPLHDGGAVMHDGGEVERMHSGGLAADEVLRVLQLGEWVTRESSVTPKTLPMLRAINQHGDQAMDGLVLSTLSGGASRTAITDVRLAVDARVVFNGPVIGNRQFMDEVGALAEAKAYKGAMAALEAWQASQGRAVSNRHEVSR